MRSMANLDRRELRCAGLSSVEWERKARGIRIRHLLTYPTCGLRHVFSTGEARWLWQFTTFANRRQLPLLCVHTCVRVYGFTQIDVYVSRIPPFFSPTNRYPQVMSELAMGAKPAGIIAKTSRRVAVVLTMSIGVGLLMMSVWRGSPSSLFLRTIILGLSATTAFGLFEVCHAVCRSGSSDGHYRSLRSAFSCR